MIRILLKSALTLLISIFIVLLLPFDIISTVNDIGPSPYRDRINELYEITGKGLHPSAPELGELDLLVEKNNIWHEQRRSSEPKGFLNAISIKSTSISPILAFLWAFSFYVIFRKELSYNALAFLSAPIIFTLYGGFSLLAFSLILVGIFVSFVCLKVKNRRANGSGAPI